MLAPALKKGMLRREVYLPAGAWSDFWTGERIVGPKMISRETPLELMPIYAREGAILFYQPAMNWLEERAPERITIELFPRERGASTAELYEDDGESDDYLRGIFCKRRIGQERREGELTVTVAAREGPFEPPARSLLFKIHLERRPERVSLDGKKLEVRDSSEHSAPCFYVSSQRVLYLSLRDDGVGHTINLA